MSMFSKVFENLLRHTKSGKQDGKFPDPACTPPRPGDPPAVKSPDPFCTTGRKPRQTMVRTLDKMKNDKDW